MMRALLLVAALMAPTWASGAEVRGTATILAGQALILRGNGRNQRQRQGKDK